MRLILENPVSLALPDPLLDRMFGLLLEEEAPDLLELSSEPFSLSLEDDELELFEEPLLPEPEPPELEAELVFFDENLEVVLELESDPDPELELPLFEPLLPEEPEEELEPEDELLFGLEFPYCFELSILKGLKSHLGAGFGFKGAGSSPVSKRQAIYSPT